jgi:hypothetical protein
MSTLPKIREMTDKMLAAEAEWLPQFDPAARRYRGDGYLAARGPGEPLLDRGESGGR